MKSKSIPGLILTSGIMVSVFTGCTLKAQECDSLSGIEKERLHRIRLDFNKKKEDILPFISRYYPEVNDSMLINWEKDHSLEMMEIDGEKWYFRNAARNLFRINPEAKRRMIEKDGETPLSGYEAVNALHVPDVIASLEGSAATQTKPLNIKVKYTLTVDAGAVKEGELVRCWLPYPREDNPRQKEVRLLSANPSNYLLSPNEYKHRSIYLEKIKVDDEPVVFEVEYSYTSAAEWFNLTPDSIRPYNIDSPIYKEYTQERDSHVRFSKRLRQLADSIRGEETNPYRIVRKTFNYINDNYPWASAREYSTIPNIPEYVVENGHGDCGQVSLLFITLCRINGIPAKWQSGFMMHPQGVNLHDWAEVWYEGIGWVPVDQSFGIPEFATDEKSRYFFANGIDAYRMVVNDDYSVPLFPEKKHIRSETVDFQRGEVETEKENLYFNQWDWHLDVSYEPIP